MKSLLILLALLPISSFATNCTDVSLEKATANYYEIQQAAHIGTAGDYDVLIAEKNILNIRLCMDSTDVTTLAALNKNIVARVKLLQDYERVGVANKTDIAFAQSERDGLSRFCPSLIKDLVEKEHVGLAPKSKLDQARQVCSEIKTFSPYQ